MEGFFAKLTKRRLKRGVFLSVVDLQAAINRFVLDHNAEPKPFTWTADPDKIIQAVRRGHQVLDSIHYQPRDGTRRIAQHCSFETRYTRPKWRLIKLRAAPLELLPRLICRHR